jgi:hypothetical protein
MGPIIIDEPARRLQGEPTPEWAALATWVGPDD